MPTLQHTQGIGQHDDRRGLGYGAVSTSGYHQSRQSSSNFPYLDPDNYDLPEEEILDDETLDAFISKVNGDYMPSDSERQKGNDPLYFVGANTRLVSCFLRTDEILVEVESVAFQLGMGHPLGSSEPTIKRAGGRVRTVPSLRVGSKKGYFGRPPMPVETDLEDVPTPDEIDQVHVWSPDDVPSDDERALIKIRRVIDAIHREQEAVNAVGEE